MTNGEKLCLDFPDVTVRVIKDDVGSAYIEVEKDDEWVADFDVSWWNAEYKEPTEKPQEPILNKIRAEIEQIKEAEYQIYGRGSWRFVDKCLDIIDKYKAESEET